MKGKKKVSGGNEMNLHGVKGRVTVFQRQMDIRQPRRHYVMLPCQTGKVSVFFFFFVFSFLQVLIHL